jgi:hypothetical protein
MLLTSEESWRQERKPSLFACLNVDPTKKKEAKRRKKEEEKKKKNHLQSTAQGHERVREKVCAGVYSRWRWNEKRDSMRREMEWEDRENAKTNVLGKME